MKKRSCILLVASFLLFGASFMYTEKTIVHDLTQQDLIKDNFHTVQEGKLYRSAQIPSNRLGAYLKQYNIKTIINLRSPVERTLFCRKEEDVAHQATTQVIYVPMSAGRASTDEEIKNLLTAFKQAQEPLLIHCSQGINRTGEACALWLIEECGAPVEEALKQFDTQYGYNKTKRPEKYKLIAGWQKTG